jgi:hypothetical protein
VESAAAAAEVLAAVRRHPPCWLILAHKGSTNTGYHRLREKRVEDAPFELREASLPLFFRKDQCPYLYPPPEQVCCWLAMSSPFNPMRVISGFLAPHRRTARRPAISRREERARCRCSVPSLAPAIYERVSAWLAMSHICLYAACQNTPTVRFPWPAMSFSLCGYSRRPG